MTGREVSIQLRLWNEVYQCKLCSKFKKFRKDDPRVVTNIVGVQAAPTAVAVPNAPMMPMLTGMLVCPDCFKEWEFDEKPGVQIEIPKNKPIKLN